MSPRSSARRLLLLGVTVLGTGCGGTRHAEPAAPRAEPTRGLRSQERADVRPRVPTPALLEEGVLRGGMRGHFAEVRRMELALLFGRLGGAKLYARSLASMTADGSLRADLLERVRGVAQRIAVVTTVDAALPLVAKLAGGCAGCHVASGAAVVVSATAEPGEDGTVISRMERHQWAADRLWEGIVTPSDERWREGLAVLQEMPLPVEALTDDRSRQSLIEGLARELATQATAAAAQPAGPSRVTALGSLLRVCAACHAAVGR